MQGWTFRTPQVSGMLLTQACLHTTDGVGNQLSRTWTERIVSQQVCQLRQTSSERGVIR